MFTAVCITNKILFTVIIFAWKVKYRCLKDMTSETICSASALKQVFMSCEAFSNTTEQVNSDSGGTLEPEGCSSPTLCIFNGVTLLTIGCSNWINLSECFLKVI